MGWTRSKIRGARDQRPGVESLETRQLLSQGGASPAVAGTFLNGNGSVNFDQVIAANAARKTYGVDGSGENVAVIDTGVDYKNPILGGSEGAGHKVVAGVDFTGSPNGVLPTWQHGTGVAGLIAGNGAGYQGVAPGAGIVALRVFGDNNQGSFDNIAHALEWVAQNHTQYHITAVNLSVSDGGNYTTDIFARDGGVGQELTGDIQTLATLNIPVVIAAGNSFDGKTQGEGFAAVVPGAIGVTATDESTVTAKNSNDSLASNAQRLGWLQGGASATKLAAPGVGITAPSGDSGTVAEDGTSFATPQVTGTIVLLQQMYQAAYNRLPTLDEINTYLQNGGDTIHDSATGIDIERLDTANSLKSLYNQIHPPGSSGSTIGTAADGSSGTTTTTSLKTTVSGTSSTVGSSPKTQVIVNGSSLGNYSTSQLSGKFARLFALTKGSAQTLRVWTPDGSKVDLGASVPSGSMVKTVPKRGQGPSQTARASHKKPAALGVNLGHHASTSKKAGSRVGPPFPS